MALGDVICRNIAQVEPSLQRTCGPHGRRRIHDERSKRGQRLSWRGQNELTALPNKSRLPKNSSICLINHFANGEPLGKRQILELRNAQRLQHLFFLMREFTLS